MKAAYYEKYGPADVVKIKEVARPVIKDNEVLVKVYAASVTTADWRIRASAFPAFTWLAGRMMLGLFAPKVNVLGRDFAGRIVAKGKDVERFKLSDEVFGCSGNGAHAEYLAVPAEGTIVRKPVNLGYDEAAAVPFGALSALAFLRDFAKIRPGQTILINGASGGVGVFAVQLAKYFGADVTGVCSTANMELVRSIGADSVIDYSREDFTRNRKTYDIILDTVGKTAFSRCRRALKPEGIYIPLELGMKEIYHALVTSMIGGKKIVIGISWDTQENLAIIRGLLERGNIRPVIDGHYPLESIADAHRRVESRHKRGSVIVTFEEPEVLSLAAE